MKTNNWSIIHDQKETDDGRSCVANMNKFWDDWNMNGIKIHMRFVNEVSFVCVTVDGA